MIKPHLCRECGTQEPNRFWGRAKTLCNRCKSKTNTKTYRQTDKGKLNHNSNNRKYIAKNKEKYNALRHKRRAAIEGNGGSHTAEEWKALKERYGNICLACKQKKKLTKDHIVPIAKGGTDNIDNIQPLCGSCNSRKHTQVIDYRY